MQINKTNSADKDIQNIIDNITKKSKEIDNKTKTLESNMKEELQMLEYLTEIFNKISAINEQINNQIKNTNNTSIH